jgi:hypothetical protein
MVHVYVVYLVRRRRVVDANQDLMSKLWSAYLVRNSDGELILAGCQNTLLWNRLLSALIPFRLLPSYCPNVFPHSRSYTVYSRTIKHCIFLDRTMLALFPLTIGQCGGCLFHVDLHSCSLPNILASSRYVCPTPGPAPPYRATVYPQSKPSWIDRFCCLPDSGARYN